MQYDYITLLLGIQGFKVKHIEFTRCRGCSAIILDLERTKEGHRCGNCGQQVQAGYDSIEEEVQHLTLWQHLTFLRFRRYRVNCPDCGIRAETLDFVDIRGPRVTKHLAYLVAELCKVMTNKAVSIFQSLHRHTVKAIDKQFLRKVQVS